MGARTLVLTHFSARYNKLPLITPPMIESTPPAAIGYDHMEWSVHDDGPHLHRLLPLLRAVFAANEREQSERASKNQGANERVGAKLQRRARHTQRLIDETTTAVGGAQAKREPRNTMLDLIGQLTEQDAKTSADGVQPKKQKKHS